jgi:hypothetical protein
MLALCQSRKVQRKRKTGKLCIKRLQRLEADWSGTRACQAASSCQHSLGFDLIHLANQLRIFEDIKLLPIRVSLAVLDRSAPDVVV